MNYGQCVSSYSQTGMVEGSHMVQTSPSESTGILITFIAECFDIQMW
jgi:hypothetical protein